MGALQQLQVDVRCTPDRVIVALEGELDMASAPLLQSTLEDRALASLPLLVLDLGQLQFIDSTGLRVVLAVRKLCAQRGQQLAVTRGSAQVERLLSVTGVAEHLRVIDSAEQPLA